MWLYPTIIVCIIICLMGYWLTVRVGHRIEDTGQERDSEIPEEINEHPFMLNPILLVYAVFLGFTGIIIFYYYAKGY
ncbi:MAG: short-chain dehydrogenase [Solibacillus sp.]|jgi:adenylate kinase|uniref:short-chain dehydrogenase n=1 Tax=unclassified Solibacillus TaxID=2637870 RepID=UPI0030FD0F4B